MTAVVAHPGSISSGTGVALTLPRFIDNAVDFTIGILDADDTVIRCDCPDDITVTLSSIPPLVRRLRITRTGGGAGKVTIAGAGTLGFLNSIEIIGSNAGWTVETFDALPMESATGTAPGWQIVSNDLIALLRPSATDADNKAAHDGAKAHAIAKGHGEVMWGPGTWSGNFEYTGDDAHLRLSASEKATLTCASGDCLHVYGLDFEGAGSLGSLRFQDVPGRALFVESFPAGNIGHIWTNRCGWSVWLDFTVIPSAEYSIDEIYALTPQLGGLKIVPNATTSGPGQLWIKSFHAETHETDDLGHGGAEWAGIEILATGANNAARSIMTLLINNCEIDGAKGHALNIEGVQAVYIFANWLGVSPNQVAGNGLVRLAGVQTAHIDVFQLNGTNFANDVFIIDGASTDGTITTGLLTEDVTITAHRIIGGATFFSFRNDPFIGVRNNLNTDFDITTLQRGGRLTNDSARFALFTNQTNDQTFTGDLTVSGELLIQGRLRYGSPVATLAEQTPAFRAVQAPGSTVLYADVDTPDLSMQGFEVSSPSIAAGTTITGSAEPTRVITFTGNGTNTIFASAGTFAATDVGCLISGSPQIQVGTIISGFTDSQHATTSLTVSPGTDGATIGARSYVIGSGSNGSTTVSGAFAASDQYRMVTSDHGEIQSDCYIVSVVAGTSATISSALTSALAAGSTVHIGARYRMSAASSIGTAAAGPVSTLIDFPGQIVTGTSTLYAAPGTPLYEGALVTGSGLTDVRMVLSVISDEVTFGLRADGTQTLHSQFGQFTPAMDYCAVSCPSGGVTIPAGAYIRYTDAFTADVYVNGSTVNIPSTQTHGGQCVIGKAVQLDGNAGSTQLSVTFKMSARGAIIPIGSRHAVAGTPGYGNAVVSATPLNINWIHGGEEGMEISLVALRGIRPIIIRNGIGNILTRTGIDVLVGPSIEVVLRYEAGTWHPTNDFNDAANQAFNTQGIIGAAVSKALATDEARSAIGLGDGRRYLGTGSFSYVLDPEDFKPSTIYADPNAGEVIGIDCTAMRIGLEYTITNQGLIGNGTDGGQMILDVGPDNQLRGNTGYIPNTVNTISTVLYPGESVTLEKDGGNRIDLKASPEQAYWAVNGNYMWKRKSDRTIWGIFRRLAATPLGAGSASTSHDFPTSFILDGATVLGVQAQPTNSASYPTSPSPVVSKMGVGGGLIQNRFELYNPATSATNSDIVVNIIGITETPVAPLSRPAVGLAVGQSFIAQMLFRASDTMFKRALQNVFATSAAAILTNSGITVTSSPASHIMLHDKAISGTAILQDHAGSAGYWVASDTTTPGTPLSIALTAIAGYSTKPQWILHSHGQQDSTGYVSSTTADNMKTALVNTLWPSLRSAINSGSPNSVPIFMDLLGPRFAQDEQHEYAIRDRIIDAINGGTNIFWGVEDYALQLDSSEHPTADIGYRQMGAHSGRKVAAWLVDHTSVPMGPTITGITRSGVRLTVAISVPSGKALVKPTTPKFFGAFNGNYNRLTLSNFSWSGNNLSFDCSAVPTLFVYPARETPGLIVDTTSIVRLANPSDPLYTGEIGLVLHSTKQTTIT